MSRLLLAEQFCPLDPEPPYEPPDKWDAPHVQHTFAAALGVVARLPGRVWPRSYANTWPKDYRRDWVDMLAMLGDGGDAYTQWVREQNFSPREKPTSVEIMHCEAALGWPGAYLLHKPELGQALNVTCLAIWREADIEDVVARGKRAGVRSASEWHRLGHEAADRVARGLRADCVAVL